jgi:hypothetical protein
MLSSRGTMEAIRFIQEAGRQRWPAIGVRVQRSGCWIRCQHVPMNGAEITLRWAHGDGRPHPVFVTGVAMQACSQPTLRHPEPGYWLQFRKVYSTANETPVREFLKRINETTDTHIKKLAGSSGEVHGHIFEDAPAPPVTSPAGSSIQGKEHRHPGHKVESNRVEDVRFESPDGINNGTIFSLSQQTLHLVVWDTKPSLYDHVVITPQYLKGKTPMLLFEGTVVEVTPTTDSTVWRLQVRIMRIDEVEPNSLQSYRQALRDRDV